jgi:hypothetical protein
MITNQRTSPSSGFPKNEEIFVIHNTHSGRTTTQHDALSVSARWGHNVCVPMRLAKLVAPNVMEILRLLIQNPLPTSQGILNSSEHWEMRFDVKTISQLPQTEDSRQVVESRVANETIINEMDMLNQIPEVRVGVIVGSLVYHTDT